MEVGDGVSAIATLIAAWVAIRSFNKWTNQKGSEVIANEAKAIFELLEEIPSRSNVVLEEMLAMVLHNKAPVDFDDKANAKNFRTLNVEIIRKLDLLKFKNKDKYTIKIIENFKDCYEQYFINYYRKSSDSEEILKTHKHYEASLTDLKNEMYEYALYKKTI